MVLYQTVLYNTQRAWTIPEVRHLSVWTPQQRFTMMSIDSLKTVPRVLGRHLHHTEDIGTQ